MKILELSINAASAALEDVTNLRAVVSKTEDTPYIPLWKLSSFNFLTFLKPNTNYSSFSLDDHYDPRHQISSINTRNIYDKN